MRKTLLVVVCLLTFLCAKAQTYSYSSGSLHVTITDSLWHDSSDCSSSSLVRYYITIDSSFVGDSIQIVDTFAGSLFFNGHNDLGVSPWTPGVMDGMGHGDYGLPGYVHFYYPVKKIVHGLDTIHAVVIHDSLEVTNPCEYGSVSGKVYIDNNSNCIPDSGDSYLNWVEVDIHQNLIGPSGSYPWLTALGAGFDGIYSTYIQKSWMTDFIVTLPESYAFIFPFSSCYAGPVTLTSLPDSNINFPLQCTHNIDVQCAILSPGKARLHRPFYMQPYVSNTGCDTASGVLTFIKDSRVSYDSALSTNPAMTVSGDTLTWTYSGLSNLSSGAYWNSFFSDLYLTPDSTLVVGDTLCFRVYTGVLPADINAANNDYSVCLPVVYSYDPNEKDVVPKGSGPEGFIGGDDTLTYTLHFQNTGSDVAENIHVIDTLDSHINASSLRILGTSQNMTPKWLAPNIVEFDYNGIYLPDSFSNEPASHGSVRFSVALNHGLPVGTQIKNTGYIYFDLNPAVVTNTTLNTIGAVSYVAPVVKHQDVKIYPNPATDNITVENLEGGTLSIVNVNGVVVLQQDIANNRTVIDVSRLADGVYFLKAVNKDNTATTKLIKY